MALDAHLGTQLHTFVIQDGVIIGYFNWNDIFVLPTFDNASKLLSFNISGKSHARIKVCIVKDIMCIVLITGLRYFIIVVDAFKFFAKIAIVLNKVYPMVRVGPIPNVSILAADFHSLLHGLVEILKHIPYLCSRLLNVGDPLNV